MFSEVTVVCFAVEKSRVCLSTSAEETSDYINASYVMVRHSALLQSLLYNSLIRFISRLIHAFTSGLSAEQRVHHYPESFAQHSEGLVEDGVGSQRPGYYFIAGHEQHGQYSFYRKLLYSVTLISCQSSWNRLSFHSSLSFLYSISRQKTASQSYSGLWEISQSATRRSLCR